MGNYKNTEKRRLQRERIISSAIQLYDRQGLSGMTMNNIGQEAGLGKATLYYYFSSKDSLFNAILEEGWSTILGIIEECQARSLSPKNAFLESISTLGNAVLTDRKYYKFLFSASLELIRADKANSSWKEKQEKVYEGFRNIIESGIENREFVDLETDTILRAMGSLFHDLVIRGGSISRSEIGKLFSRFFIS